MEKNTLRLNPGDYIVLKGGLKIENTSEDLSMKVEMPTSYEVTVMEITNKLTPHNTR